MTANTFTIHLDGPETDYEGVVGAVSARNSVTVSGGSVEEDLTTLFHELVSRADPNAPVYVQMEKTVHCHIHVVFEGGCMSDYSKRTMLGEVKNAVADLLRSAGKAYTVRNIQFLRQRNGAHRRITFIDYVLRYLYNKRKWSVGKEGYMSRFWSNVPPEWLAAAQPLLSGGTTKDMDVMSNKAVDFETCLTNCVKSGVGSMEKLRETFPTLYLNKMSSQGGKGWLKMLLEMARETIVNDCSFGYYLKGIDAQLPCPDNYLTRLMMNNGICPGAWCITLYRWSTNQAGKRNTLFFYGPASTGKTLICEALSRAAPFYGNVNKNNDNFPFNDCHNQSVIWWEEASINDKTVEDAKAVMGGTQCRIDKKGGDSTTVPPTPVMITSNNTIWQVTSGNSITTIHEQPLKARWTRFNLYSSCATQLNFTYPGPDESLEGIKECYSWGEANAHALPQDKMKELPWSLGHHEWEPKLTVASWSLTDGPSTSKMGVQEKDRQEEELGATGGSD